VLGCSPGVSDSPRARVRSIRLQVNCEAMAKALATVLFCSFVAAAACAQNANQLTITTDFIEPCVVDESCYQQLHASGGTAPLDWHIAKGSLPEGLDLDAGTGVVSGSAADAANYEVLIEVSDSSKPVQKTSRLYTSKTVPSLTLDWKVTPTLQVTTISGSVTVSNNGADALDLTVIIVAVNEAGKAFALGYQRFNLQRKTIDQPIAFGAQLPAGRYTVRADAIGEVAQRRKIYRAAREAGPLQVPPL
jgi:Putative Ig domain